eukprot:790777-Pelagomonas_calceolata.AAC.1
MVCDKTINLDVAADAGLRAFTAGTFRAKSSFRSTTLPTYCTPRFGSSRRMQSLLECMQVKSGLPLTYDKAKRWTIPYRSGY